MGSGGGSKKRESSGYTRKDMEELDEHWKSNYEELSEQHERQGQELEQAKLGTEQQQELHNVERAALLGAEMRRPPIRIRPRRNISPVEEAIAAALAKRGNNEENQYLLPPRFARPPGQ